MLFIVGVIAGCSALTDLAMKSIGSASKDGISVDAQIGDRENDVELSSDSAQGARDIRAKGNSQVEVTNSNTDSNVEKADKVIVQNIPPWVFILAIIGWVVPTPQSMFKGVKRVWQGRMNRPQ